MEVRGNALLAEDRSLVILTMVFSNGSYDITLIDLLRSAGVPFKRTGGGHIFVPLPTAGGTDSWYIIPIVLLGLIVPEKLQLNLQAWEGIINGTAYVVCGLRGMPIRPSLTLAAAGGGSNTLFSVPGGLTRLSMVISSREVTITKYYVTSVRSMTPGPNSRRPMVAVVSDGRVQVNTEIFYTGAAFYESLEDFHGAWEAVHWRADENPPNSCFALAKKTF